MILDAKHLLYFVQQLKASQLTFFHPCATETFCAELLSNFPGGGEHLITFLAQGGGNLKKKFPRIQMPGGLPGGDVEASI